MKKFISIFVVSGLVHTLFSLYWAFGGTAGLLSVGSWVFTFNAQWGIWMNLMLIVVGLFKGIATLAPLYLMKTYNKILFYISCIGSVFLMIYGGLNTVVGWLKLLQVIQYHDFYTTFGQAMVWDPLFLLWGIGLFGFLMKIKKQNTKQKLI
ncbi:MULTISPECIES: DUF3995 domain-containing protein [Mammaliicoccus]|uniref:DUF3995 domain-containing protein n=1 Tax=Mammaliicoccus lentus TaxID=42858 RepID=A0AAX3W6I2_MAMLE|nr:DUF3995 domain-containing protein [Mammaliicoccus lentus]MBF0748624.1 DUF3995 domain-containing protein [Mammaliicoccus lentus]TFU58615.1 DUF3995 domain-containing protein [Mammaliicoccus lentus]WHI60562.1 DUF3995 domain-containing protein [Mammaliicoccus lentus]WQK49720.1 DUF3995 domain-containing protein [Mammaliicoccus lentus]